ncbi:DND1 protein, partial [Centropus bengalensis]|nr:DND1 protein [Centropus bengalensis]
PERAQPKWFSAINEQNKAALAAWARETGTELVQTNGQRRYGAPPPGWVGAPPPDGSEVFIGKLPQDVYENVLIPLFQSVGKLYEFRLMMTFSGLNRGFAYARYSSRHGARQAVSTLHKFQVREGCAIVVYKSTEKRELSVDGLHGSVTPQGLRELLQRLTDGVLGVSLHASPWQRGAQLAVLKYSSHHAAAMAKRALLEGEGQAGGLCGAVKVDWLKAELKHKLQTSEQKLSPSQAHRDRCVGVPSAVSPSPVPHTALSRLIALCQRRFQGTPLFFTRCVQAIPSGWLQFSWQVEIPGCLQPITGFTWVRQEEREELKVTVALQVLRMLGESSHGVSASPRLPQNLGAAPGSRGGP